jgi:dihydropteroate synthase
LPTKRTTKAPPSNRAVEQANYAAWKILAGADLLQRHDVKPGIIPERLWRKLYIRGMTPQKAADQAAVSANNTMSPADRLKRLKR